MAKKEFSKSIVLLLVLFIVAALALTGINTVTAPIIEANGASAQFEPLFAVMPEAENFEVLYDVNDAASSALADVPATVQGVYSETSGLGSNASKPAFKDQFIGKSGTLAVSKDGGEIEALTGATITSRGVTESVNSALAAAASMG